MLAVWVAATVGIAWLVARNTEPNTDQVDLPSDIPAVAASDRATVSLAEHLIAPVVSGEARVIRDGATFLLEAPAQPADVAYKLLDPPVEVRALIQGGPAGFACPWAGLGQGGDGDVTMRCTIPAEVRVVAGMTGTMVLQMGQPTSTQALPVTAVVGSNDQGQVIVVGADGTTSIRTVQLGASDAFWIEITGGLESTETVLEVPTQRDFGAAGR